MDDPGSGQPPAMQVTLAMRRLRETVYEIIEGVKQMSGDGGASAESGEYILLMFGGLAVVGVFRVSDYRTLIFICPIHCL